MPKKKKIEEDKKEIIDSKKANSSSKTKKEEKKVSKVTKKNNEMPKWLEWFDKYRLAIYGVIGGVLVSVFVTILIWPDRIAKLEDGKEPVAEIDGLVITAEDLYEDMKQIYSISSLLEKIDNKILEEKYPENDEMEDEVKSQAENYYNIYDQYGTSKEEFLANNGFGSEAAFLAYLRLDYRRNKYVEDYIKSLITEDEIQDYYDDNVYGDINTKHILVKVNNTATDEEKEEAKKLAEEIITKLNEGKTFDEDSITYEELGYKSYNANLEDAYKEEMQKLADDSYSKKPVETSYGYHIVYRIDQKAKPSLEDVKEEIIETLSDKKSEEDKNISYIALDKMRTDAGIKFHDTVLEKKYNTYMEHYK